MALAIEFKGWFQARFATDPDPYDHPRGDEGWTFAFEGEPNFDRIIRIADPVAPRTHGPAVGVAVTAVTVDGADVPGHPLVGAPLELQDGPKFEGHNGDISPDGREPVFPFHLRLAAGPLWLEIREWLAFGDLTRPVARPRFGRGAGQLDDNRLLNVLGTTNLPGFRGARKQALQNDLAQTSDPVMRMNLQQRLARMDDTGIPLVSLGFVVPYGFAVPNASRAVSDPAGSLGGGDPLSQAWQMDWWMGCWDADVLCGFMNGHLRIGGAAPTT